MASTEATVGQGQLNLNHMAGSDKTFSQPGRPQPHTSSDLARCWSLVPGTEREEFEPESQSFEDGTWTRQVSDVPGLDGP